MKLCCDECGFVVEAEEAPRRFAREEDGAERGTLIPVCPICGSSDLFETRGMCDDCAFTAYDFTKEIYLCGCLESEWFGEEVGSDMGCTEWARED